MICYAMKANSNQSVIRTFVAEGAGCDVVSEGELRRALAAGCPPERIVFAGVGKTAREIAFAVDTGIYCFNAESEPEIALHLGDRGGQGPDGEGRRPRQPGRRRQDPPQDHHGQGREQVRHPLSPRPRGLCPCGGAAGHPARRRRHAYRQPDHRPRPVRRGLRAASPISSATSAPTAIRSTMSMPAAASASPTASTILRRPSPPPMARSCAAASAISAAASCSSRAASSSAMPASSSPRWST